MEKTFEEYKKVYPKEASELEADICGDADVNIEIENSEKLQELLLRCS